MKRFKKFVIEADKGIILEVSEETNGKLIIKATSEKKDYTNPPIPDGFRWMEGKWDEGFVIESRSTYSHYVWIPVGYLDADGTLDGKKFSKKFGRRNYLNDEFSDEEFNEKLEDELLKQLESIKKYGGFYISRYNISRTPKGEYLSYRGFKPCVNISYYEAKRIAANLENSETVKSHLVYGAEYDSVLAWIIKSKAKTIEEITEDSGDCGNYVNNAGSLQTTLDTGIAESWSMKNIYDLAGNVDEWTQEKYGNRQVIRGGNCDDLGFNSPVACRNWLDPMYNSNRTGFRVALCIK